MLNLVFYLTLLNIGIMSQNVDVFNKQVEKIEQLSGKQLDCKISYGETYVVAAACASRNAKEIMSWEEK